MWRRYRKDRAGRFSERQETSLDDAQNERIGQFSDGPRTFESPPREEPPRRFSSGQETLSETPNHTRVGRFSDGQEKDQRAAEVADRVRVDHGLPGMSFRTAFARRKEITPRASDQGLIEAANRMVFHDRGFTLTWDTATGDLWLTPTANPEGWWYDENVG
jgi:hypothetical protein